MNLDQTGRNLSYHYPPTQLPPSSFLVLGLGKDSGAKFEVVSPDDYLGPGLTEGKGVIELNS